MTNQIHCFEKAGLGVAPFRVVGFYVKKYQACQGAPIQPGTCCDYCGTGIMNVYEIKSSDGRLFKVGCDCVAKTADKVLTDGVKVYQRKAREEKAAAKREAIRAARGEKIAAMAARFIDEHGLATPLATDHYIVRDIAAKIAKYGSVSPGAVALVRKLAWEIAYKATQPVETNVPAPTGRVVCRGVVVSTKIQESAYGSVRKMIVKCGPPEATWLVYVSVPNGCYDMSVPGPLRGCEVEFTATLERGRDAHFAFGKRPTKARIVARVFE